MAVEVEIRGALQQRLAAVPGLPAVAPEGVVYKPAPGTPYVVPTVAFTSNKPQGLTPQSHIHRGSFEIGVVYPGGRGTLDAETMADAIKAVFQPQTKLVQGGTTVIVWNVQRRGAVQADADWTRVHLSVTWVAIAPTA